MKANRIISVNSHQVSHIAKENRSGSTLIENKPTNVVL